MLDVTMPSAPLPCEGDEDVRPSDEGVKDSPTLVHQQSGPSPRPTSLSTTLIKVKEQADPLFPQARFIFHPTT